MKKTIIIALIAVAGLAACGSEGGDNAIVSDIEAEPCPKAGETLPVDMVQCSRDGDFVALGDRVYPDGCISVRVGDGLYAKRGEVVVETEIDPCETQ